jgi:hypothetical protein
MTKQELLSLMMRQENRVIDPDLYTTAALLAETVAATAKTLDPKTLDRFVRIGAAIYAHGLDEFKDPVPVEDLFPASENWPRPSTARAGFRKNMRGNGQTGTHASQHPLEREQQNAE